METILKTITGFSYSKVLGMNLSKVNLNSEQKILLAFSVIFIATFFLFYPSFYWAPDEAQYLRNAGLLLSGNLKITNPLYSYAYIFNGSEYVTQYPILHSVFLVPFALLGWQNVFLYGLFFHFLNLFIFCRILKKLQLPLLYSLLFLLFPAFVFLSKSLFADMSSLTLLLLAYLFYLNPRKKSNLLSGAFFGLSLLARYTNILALAAVALILLCRDRKKLALLMAAAAPFAIAALLYNNYMYGGFFTTGYHLSSLAVFSLGELPSRFFYFVLLLSAFYPLMFFSPLFAQKRLRAEAALSAIFFTFFFSVYSWSYFNFNATDLVTGISKLVPVIFLLILTFASAFERALSRANLAAHRAKILVAVAILLLVPAVIVQAELKERQDLKYAAFQEIYSETKAGALIVADEQFRQLPAMKESPFTGMFFSEMFGDRKLTTLKQPYQQYISSLGEENTYYMRMWIEGSRIETDIMPWTQFEQGG